MEGFYRQNGVAGELLANEMIIFGPTRHHFVGEERAKVLSRRLLLLPGRSEKDGEGPQNRFFQILDWSTKIILLGDGETAIKTQRCFFHVFPNRSSFRAGTIS